MDDVIYRKDAIDAIKLESSPLKTSHVVTVKEYGEITMKNGDLISRQSAIEILGKHCNRDYGKVCGKDCECIEYMALRDWPSAQRWIPCSERLPERNGYYLVTGRQGAVNKRLYQDGYWYGNWAIIAWMPLPSPYREEETPT